MATVLSFNTGRPIEPAQHQHRQLLRERLETEPLERVLQDLSDGPLTTGQRMLCHVLDSMRDGHEWRCPETLAAQWLGLGLKVQFVAPLVDVITSDEGDALYHLYWRALTEARDDYRG